PRAVDDGHLTGAGAAKHGGLRAAAGKTCPVLLVEISVAIGVDGGADCVHTIEDGVDRVGDAVTIVEQLGARRGVVAGDEGERDGAARGKRTGKTDLAGE